MYQNFVKLTIFQNKMLIKVDLEINEIHLYKINV